MSDNNNSHSTKAAAAEKDVPAKPSSALPRRRSPLPLVILAALFIILPFLAWYGTWFGRELSDEKITEYLSDESKPRHVQHAMAQIAERLEKKDAGAKRWYPQIVALAGSNMTELRSNVAWLMGKDNQSEEFHAALLRLVNDREPIVQRNAALSLVTFGDSSGREVIRQMLQPFSLASTATGTISSVLKEGSPVTVGMLLVRIRTDEGKTIEVRSPLPGEISKVIAPEGAKIGRGETMLILAPDSQSVWEALRALLLVGVGEDLPLVEPYASGVEKMPERVKQQAALTAKAIRSRLGNSK